MPNIFDEISNNPPQEVLKTLLESPYIRIERIISKGHTSPESGWYDQEQSEWVLLIEGAAIITYEDGEEIKLQKDDYLNIPAHVKHKVSWTDPNCETIWLAVFYGDK